MVSVRYLNECDLKSLGITRMGPRKVIMRSVEALRGGFVNKNNNVQISSDLPCFPL